MELNYATQTETFAALSTFERLSGARLLENYRMFGMDSFGNNRKLKPVMVGGKVTK